MKETHPYPPFISDNATKLIIGTTPPQRFTNNALKSEIAEDDVNFFYGSRDNYFWEILENVFDVQFKYANDLESIKQRKEFLEKNNFGIMDIVNEFERNKNNASDNNLNVLSYQNLVEILKKNPQINMIYFTGGTTESLVSKQLGEHKIFNTIIGKNPKTKKFKVENREVLSVTLFSPSPAARKSMKNRIEQYKILNK